MFNQLNERLQRIREQNPLILNITNYVTMDFIANGLLSLGASPVMSKSEDELHDLIAASQAIVINLGTLNTEFISLCKTACQIANALQIPIIFDPVGAGATTLRTETCEQFIHDHRISIIRGNANEIQSLAGIAAQPKGVDSMGDTHEAISSAQAIARNTSAVVVVSGKTDIVANAETVFQSDRGAPIMRKITGMGCLLSAVVAAFRAIEIDDFAAAQDAVTFYGICGEMADQKASGPGTFRMHFIDALFTA